MASCKNKRPVGENVEKFGALVPAGGKANGAATIKKKYGMSSRNSK